MFRTAELGRQVDKDAFRALAPPLRIELIELQQELRRRAFPVIIVFAGVNGAGKSESVNLLNEWMDPRWLVTRAYGPPSDEEGERPHFWRYWRDLPPAGTTGLFLSSWYSRPVLGGVYGTLDDGALEHIFGRINAFEGQLADDGALIVKFWMHLSKPAQKRRLKQLERDPHEAWRVTKEDWRNWKHYDRFILLAEKTIMRTSPGHAPWVIVEGADSNYRSLTVLTTLRDRLARHFARRTIERREATAVNVAAARAGAATAVSLPHQPSMLSSLDLGLTLPRKTYERALQAERARLNGLYRRAKAAGRSTVLVFEGWDAAGKGGTIRRLATAMDARDIAVIPIAAPTDEERAHHYLWRFWRHMSRAGRVTVFDRSWYGRVLVERVEDLCTAAEWRRAYSEINDFERQLVEHGIIVVKFWMHISPDEQLERFKQRESIVYKRWKLTDEDWRNREKWADYEAAVEDMISQTSTHVAPWTLLEANCKRHARIKAFRTVCGTLEAALDDGGA